MIPNCNEYKWITKYIGDYWHGLSNSKFQLFNWHGENATLGVFEYALDNGEIKDTSNEYLNHCNGFTEGYNRAERLYGSGTININDVFEVIKNFNFNIPKQTIKVGDKKHSIPLQWFDYGVSVGKLYFAWFIVSEKQNEFEPLFNEFMNPDTSSKSVPSQQTETNITGIQNNFDNVNIIEVYKHFKSGLVDKKYLTEQELIQYLKAAFELKIIPKTLFKIKDAPTKQKVMKVFYEYYKNIAGKPHRKKNKYAALLGDYFTGYNTENVSGNFNK